MIVFRLSIDDHAGHFGESQVSERTVLRAVLADVAQALGSGRPLIGTQPIVINGSEIGSFSFGAKAHSFVPTERPWAEAPEMGKF